MHRNTTTAMPHPPTSPPPPPPPPPLLLPGVLKTAMFYPLDISRVRITADMAYAGQARNYTTIRQAMASTLAQVSMLGGGGAGGGAQ